ncbi:MAG: DUF4157 domain-containing protein [Oscillospiraceae bacterium]|nr:DUF4157 domain-containing protein [Oscillospiraceae bacterium]
MSYTYAQQKKAPGAKTGAIKEGAASQRSEAPQSGAAIQPAPSAADAGRRADLSEAMRARMEASFGPDLSAVRLYAGRTAADAGEGVHSGATAPLSTASAAPAAGPMQAKRDRGEQQVIDEEPNGALLHRPERWQDARWSLGKRFRNWYSTKKKNGLTSFGMKTGLSGFGWNVRKRMKAEMDSMDSTRGADEDAALDYGMDNPVFSGGANKNAALGGQINPKPRNLILDDDDDDDNEVYD